MSVGFVSGKNGREECRSWLFLVYDHLVQYYDQIKFVFLSFESVNCLWSFHPAAVFPIFSVTKKKSSCPRRGQNNLNNKGNEQYISHKWELNLKTLSLIWVLVYQTVKLYLLLKSIMGKKELCGHYSRRHDSSWISCYLKFSCTASLGTSTGQFLVLIPLLWEFGIEICRNRSRRRKSSEKKTRTFDSDTRNIMKLRNSSIRIWNHKLFNIPFEVPNRTSPEFNTNWFSSPFFLPFRLGGTHYNQVFNYFYTGLLDLLLLVGRFHVRLSGERRNEDDAWQSYDWVREGVKAQWRWKLNGKKAE